MRVLLTSTSFQDTPGPHHELLAEKGFEIVRERGPLTESQMLERVGDFDAFLCGDDAITAHRIGKTPSSPQSRRQIRHRFGQGGCRYCNGIENTCHILPWRTGSESGQAERYPRWTAFTRAEIEGFTHIRSELGEQACQPEDFRTVTI